MGIERYPDGQRPPLDERWPGTEQAGQGPLHLDPAGLRRALDPLVSKLGELGGAGKGGLRDISERAGRARGGGAWGAWLTADRVNNFHGSVVELYLACYREMLTQLGRVLELAKQNAHTTTGADADAGQSFVDIRDNAAGIAVPDSSSTPIAPVSNDGSFD